MLKSNKPSLKPIAFAMTTILLVAIAFGCSAKKETSTDKNPVDKKEDFASSENKTQSAEVDTVSTAGPWIGNYKVLKILSCEGSPNSESAFLAPSKIDGKYYSCDQWKNVTGFLIGKIPNEEAMIGWGISDQNGFFLKQIQNQIDVDKSGSVMEIFSEISKNNSKQLQYGLSIYADKGLNREAESLGFVLQAESNGNYSLSMYLKVDIGNPQQSGYLKVKAELTR